MKLKTDFVSSPGYDSLKLELKLLSSPILGLWRVVILFIFFLVSLVVIYFFSIMFFYCVVSNVVMNFISIVFFLMWPFVTFVVIYFFLLCFSIVLCLMWLWILYLLCSFFCFLWLYIFSLLCFSIVFFYVYCGYELWLSGKTKKSPEWIESSGAFNYELCIMNYELF